MTGPSVTQGIRAFMPWVTFQVLKQSARLYYSNAASSHATDSNLSLVSCIAFHVALVAPLPSVPFLKIMTPALKVGETAFVARDIRTQHKDSK